MSEDQVQCRDALYEGKRLLKAREGAAAMVRPSSGSMRCGGARRALHQHRCQNRFDALPCTSVMRAWPHIELCTNCPLILGRHLQTIISGRGGTKGEGVKQTYTRSGPADRHSALLLGGCCRHNSTRPWACLGLWVTRCRRSVPRVAWLRRQSCRFVVSSCFKAV